MHGIFKKKERKQNRKSFLNNSEKEKLNWPDQPRQAGLPSRPAKPAQAAQQRRRTSQPSSAS
jgi:hypothetical protein